MPLFPAIQWINKFRCFLLFVKIVIKLKKNNPRIDLLFFKSYICQNKAKITRTMKHRMNTPNFNLRNAKSTKSTPIILIFRYGEQKLKYGTGLKVHPDDWNVKKHRAKEGGQKDLIELNKRLEFIQKQTIGIYLEYLNNEIVLRPGTFKEELDKVLFPERETENTFFGYFDKYLDRYKDSYNTWRGRMTVKNLLLKYAETLKSKRLDFEDFDMEFYQNFKTWVKKEGYADNYFGKAISVIKQVLSDAYDIGLYDVPKPVHMNKKFKAPAKDVHNEYLTMNELEDIYSLDLSNIKRLETVRDMFILACLTGLRYSDMINLTPDHFSRLQGTGTSENGYYLQMITEKTDEEIAVPVHPTVIEILEKYKWELPKPISNQKFNDYLKEIAKEAGINNMVQTEIRSGNKETGYKRVSKMVPKWKLITTHTGRRSFVSNADMEPDLVMSMVGHKSASMFLKYNKKKPIEKAKRASKGEFFRTPLMRKVK